MLSICIPHFNFQNPALFIKLKEQASSLGIVYEILIFDDASEEKNLCYLKDFNKPPYRLHFLKENIGRSAIRNLLAAQAKYKWILFLDGDSGIDDDFSLANYFNYLNFNIISGGRKYVETEPPKTYLLHWNYGVRTESFAKSSFHSNNFMIRKSIFSKIQFDEQIREYGYEDVVFGLEAQQLNLKMININNPVVHQQLKHNDEFIADVEQAILNLLHIQQLRKNLDLSHHIKLVSHYQKLKKWQLHLLLSPFNKTLIKYLKRTLLKANSSANKEQFLLKLLKLYLYHHFSTAGTPLHPSSAHQHLTTNE
ncbi:MAG: glycosyltransferase family 2 protein [Sphingobacteriales bacterium]|nr:glycosyltransferase family 2 protein [Sphingobacteriales bacterium]